MMRVVVKPYSTGTGPVGITPRTRDGQPLLIFRFGHLGYPLATLDDLPVVSIGVYITARRA